LTTLTPADFHKTLGPKVQGLNNLLSTVNPKALKLLITFGSLIARTGLRGEADYALANEWLANLVEKFQQAQPSCRCLNLEWSIWSGVGMGERLGRVDVLLREGITPISPDIGISILRQLVAQPLPVTSVVITGRFGEAPTLRMEHPEFPFLRFLEQPRIYYPGIELVVDADLSVGTDPYLNDHVYEGERIFPAVMGLEAMAQVVTALAGPLKFICFEDVQFNRPVVVPANDSLKIRIAALVRSHNYVDVVIRTEQTAFQVDHFRATYSISHNSTLKPQNDIQKSIRLLAEVGNREQGTGNSGQELTQSDAARSWGFPRGLQGADAGSAHSPSPGATASRTLSEKYFCKRSIVQQQNPLSSLFGSPNSTTECVISLNPDQDLYGGILFHSGRFRRLRGYHKLRAKECIAELLPEQGSLWFSPYLPADFLLGDPAARDAAIHALQACIPHVTLLPAGVKQILINPGLFEQARYIHAQERSQFQNTFIYDLEILSEDGKVLERWKGLCLKVIGSVNTQQTWAAPLLGPYLERQIHELIPGADIAVVVDKDTSIERKVKRDRTIQHILSNGNGRSTSPHPALLTHRPDGKPEVITDATGIHQDKSVSVGYSGELMLAVAGATLIGCDVEPVVCRTLELWQDLLSAERFSLAQLLVHEAGQDLDTAATCIWTACECLKKAGVIVTAPLVLNSSAPEGWILLNTGSLMIATCVVSVQDIQEKLVLSVLTHKEVKNVD
ncbi:MAG: KR domain-containing protein, partial [Moorea sp. SIO2I5]|nr:KR domain-containing protein [Moorena sp. SIO2I5]